MTKKITIINVNDDIVSLNVDNYDSHVDKLRNDLEDINNTLRELRNIYITLGNNKDKEIKKSANHVIKDVSSYLNDNSYIKNSLEAAIISGAIDYMNINDPGILTKRENRKENPFDKLSDKEKEDFANEILAQQFIMDNKYKYVEGEGYTSERIDYSNYTPTTQAINKVIEDVKKAGGIDNYRAKQQQKLKDMESYVRFYNDTLSLLADDKDNIFGYDKVDDANVKGAMEEIELLGGIDEYIKHYQDLVNNKR